MRSTAVKFLILTLFSCHGYAGPFNGGPGGGRIGPNIRPDIRPDIRPGQRGSNIQEALGSSQNQYSPLNPGSNQSVFLLNNIISQQLLNDGPGGTTDISFSPANPLPGGLFEHDMHAEALPLMERDLASNFILMPPPKPFASKVAKSRTQGMVFVTKMHKDQPSNASISSPIGSSASAKLTAARSQGVERVEQAINNETQLISSQLQLINQQIQEQLTIFNNKLQSTGQTLGGMSQPVSSDSAGSSSSK